MIKRNDLLGGRTFECFPFLKVDGKNFCAGKKKRPFPKIFMLRDN